MHKKSIEAAKALKDEDDNDGAANGSESGKPRRDQPLQLSSSAVVEHGLPPTSDRRSVDPSSGGEGKGGGVDDSVRSESIAVLRAKVR